MIWKGTGKEHGMKQEIIRHLIKWRRNWKLTGNKLERNDNETRKKLNSNWKENRKKFE